VQHTLATREFDEPVRPARRTPPVLQMEAHTIGKAAAVQEVEGLGAKVHR